MEALEFMHCEGIHAGRERGLPKLILLDLKMLRMDGLQVLERLRGSERTRHIPVETLTSSAEETDLVRGYSPGVDSFIVKPVDFAQFAEIVSQVGMYWVLANQVPG